MSDLLELDDNDYEVDDQTSLGELDSTSEVSPSKRQPAKVNLDELPEFRKFKSESQKREAQARNQAEALARQLQQVSARQREIEMAGMDDVQRIAYENNELKRMIAERDAEENRRYAEFVWSSLVDEVVREHGVPKELLEDAKDSNDLWRIGRNYEKRNPGKGKRVDDDDEDDDPNVDDRVSLSVSGKASSLQQRLRQEYRTAKANNDWAGMNAAKDKAYAKGIDPDSLRN